MSRKLRVRANPAASFFGGVVGLVFVVIGFSFAIPNIGAFGVLWTLVALGITIANFYNAFSQHGIASEIIEVSDGDASGIPPQAPDAETRLRRLNDLQAKGLITPAEYAQRRAAILKEI